MAGAQRLERLERQAPADTLPVLLPPEQARKVLASLGWKTISPTIRFATEPQIVGDETTIVRLVRLPFGTADSTTLNTRYFKLCGMDTLQYALYLLHQWVGYYETQDRRGAEDFGDIYLARTDSLLNNPVIKEREIVP